MNACVQVALRHCRIAAAAHPVKIDTTAVVEAFPTAFLGVMLHDPASVIATRGDRSDVFFQSLTADGTMERLMAHLLPGRVSAASLEDVTNHYDRAALVCALTALCVASGDFTAAGDSDGWMILPPYLFTQGWARVDLEVNARDEASACSYFRFERSPVQVPGAI